MGTREDAVVDERPREILKLIIRSYITSGEPVGSRTLSKVMDSKLSPATIRNIMSDLEDAGENELLNWIPLAGAMHELGQAPSYCEFIESYLMNSCKCVAIFPPA